MPTIDTTTYDKAKAYPPRHGYQLRGTKPTSIVVHSTSSATKFTPFAAEANYLYTSADVSAHYLIGKSGQIVRFLEPSPWQAWHAGAALEAWQNSRSIGIELHHSVGDPPYPTAQKNALAWLLRDLTGAFGIPLDKIETHGWIAIPGPYKRKVDPIDWSHDNFIAWRDALMPAPIQTFTLLAPTAIFETPTPFGPIALDGQAQLRQGERVEIDEVRKDGWAHLKNGVGFICRGVLG